MWIKYVGGGLLLAFALMYCLLSNRRMRQARCRLWAWIALLTHIRSHIACFGTPLRDILRRTDRAMLIALALDGAGESERELIERCRADASELPGESGTLLRSLADELGTVWRQQQLERLDYYIAALRQEHDAYAKTLSERLRLRGALCLCGTLGVLLLIW